MHWVFSKYSSWVRSLLPKAMPGGPCTKVERCVPSQWPLLKSQASDTVVFSSGNPPGKRAYIDTRTTTKRVSTPIAVRLTAQSTLIRLGRQTTRSHL